MKNLSKKILMSAVAAAIMATTAVPALAKTKLGTVGDLYWNEEENKITEAVWEEVDNAYQYEVYLYCDESKAADIKTKKTNYNFKKKMTKEGNYTFKVRALAKDKDKDYSSGSWSDLSMEVYINATRAEYNSGKVTVTGYEGGPGAVGTSQDQPNQTVPANPSGPSTPAAQAGSWVKDDAGWWYRKADGSYPSSGWFQDPADNNWYMFDASGYMMTGWIAGTDGKTYYCDPAGSPAGAMVTGDRVIDGVQYRFDASGAKIAP